MTGVSKPGVILVALLTVSGCVRWGIPDDEGIADENGSESDSSNDSSSESDSSSDTTDTNEPEPWPEQWPFSAESRLVVWGKSGIPTSNPTMLTNVFYYLAAVTPGEAQLSILWVGNCDPRTDAQGCLAGNVQPFFDLVDGLGTIEFKTLNTVDPAAYDLVIADFCSEVDGQQIATLLADGAGVLAMGDGFCLLQGRSSAEVANDTLAHFGVRFSDDQLFSHDFTIPVDKQVDLLAEVPSLDAWGVSLQESVGPIEVAAETLDGYVLTRRSEP